MTRIRPLPLLPSTKKGNPYEEKYLLYNPGGPGFPLHALVGYWIHKIRYGKGVSGALGNAGSKVVCTREVWYRGAELNRQPTAYETAALTVELPRLTAAQCTFSPCPFHRFW